MYYTEKEIETICQKSILFENDIHSLACMDITTLPNWLQEYAREVLYDFFESHGEPWDDYDPEYPNNLYHWGYVVFGNIYITGYSGVAGKFWFDQDGSLCMYWGCIKTEKNK